MAKVESINISGIRGIKGYLPLPLNRNSALIFAENGVGKSSIADAIEWYYTGAVQHLISEEAPSTKGKGSLRNLLISEDEDAFVEIRYSNSKLDSKKSIDSTYKTSTSNNSIEFKEFISASQSENLILRYRDLVGFIIAGKTEKLQTIQEIIGFSEVARLRDLLRKSARKIGQDIKVANYENQMNAQQTIIIENINQTAFNNEQFIIGVNKLIKPLKIGKEISSLGEIHEVLETIESKEDTAGMEQISLHTRIGEKINEVVGNVDTINASYESYYANYMRLKKDPEKIKQLQLLSLLKEGYEVLNKDVIQEDYCPLCQQGKNKIELIRELLERITEFEALEQERKELEEECRDLKEVLQFNSNTVAALLQEKKLEEDKSILDDVKKIKDSIDRFSIELKKELVSEEKIDEPDKIYLNKKSISTFVKKEQDLTKSLIESKDKNIKLHIYTRLYLSEKAFNEYKKIEKTLGIRMRQQQTFQVLFAEFIKKQENALNTFLTMFSSVINECYTTMNPAEAVADIKLIPIKDSNDEMVGITMEYKFYDTTRTLPKAYLSESHINCLGLSFFLASAKAFNKGNDFLIIDDIISSYDKLHRARFVKLLTQNFKDYQVVLLTHEHDFYELMSSDVKGKNWLVTELTWSDVNGVEIGKGTLDVQERILEKFRKKEIEGLGNDIRIYTEKVMKEIALNIEAQVAFRYNETNERRMASELLDAVQSRIVKKGDILNKEANIPKLQGMPMFIGNVASHDSDFKESISDLELMWEDIQKTVAAFLCDECKGYISLQFYDNVFNKIRCKCGNLSYDWKP